MSGDGHITSRETFSTWYRDVPGTNSTLDGAFLLFASEQDTYVNRYKDTGESWMATDEYAAPFCGSVGQEALDEQGDIIPCTFCVIMVQGDTECTRQLTDCDADPTLRCTKQRNDLLWREGHLLRWESGVLPGRRGQLHVCGRADDCQDPIGLWGGVG